MEILLFFFFSPAVNKSVSPQKRIDILRGSLKKEKKKVEELMTPVFSSGKTREGRGPFVALLTGPFAAGKERQKEQDGGGLKTVLLHFEERW